MKGGLSNDDVEDEEAIDLGLGINEGEGKGFDGKIDDDSADEMEEKDELFRVTRRDIFNIHPDEVRIMRALEYIQLQLFYD